MTTVQSACAWAEREVKREMDMVEKATGMKELSDRTESLSCSGTQQNETLRNTREHAYSVDNVLGYIRTRCE